MHNVYAIEFKDRHNEFTVEEQAVIVNLNTFEIAGNEGGEDVWSKVVDTGVYTLLNDDMEPMYEIFDDYVPNCIPNEYQDYLDIKVEDGKVSNWTSTNEEILAEFEERGCRV